MEEQEQPNPAPVDPPTEAAAPAPSMEGAPEPVQAAVPEPTPETALPAPEPEPVTTTEAPTQDLDDLDSEINAALGGMSVEEIMDSEEQSSKNLTVSTDGRRTRDGVIAKVHGNDVLVEFGPKSQGICPLSQFEEAPEPGSTHAFVVERFDPFDGVLVVSLPGAIQKADWGTLEVGQVIEARCTGMNRGGLEMEVDHHKAFMPAGQVDLHHLPDISVLIGEKFPCKVIELKKNKNRLILSRKAVLLTERSENKKKLLEEIEEGQVRTATITSIQNYGAFADLGGVDGLIHISDLAHEHVRSPKEILKVGDKVEVKVLKIDDSGEQLRIGLGRKQLLTDPVSSAMAEITQDAELTGKVTKTTDFGAFVEIAPGIEGLLHISQIAHERIGSVDEILKKGEVVRVKVVSIDEQRRRISLSMKALIEAPKREESAPSGKRRGRGRDRGDREPQIAREEDPGMRKLKARFSGELKGGLG